MKNKDIIACVFITTNPYCNLNEFYKNRIIQSINELETVNKQDTIATSNLSLKLNKRFIIKTYKGKETIQQPINFNVYIRWGKLYYIGWLFDFIIYASLICISIFLIIK